MPFPLHWATDLHLNFVDPDDLKHFLQEVRAHHPAALLIAGDIGEAPTLVGYLKEIEAACKVPLYFVLGNHDFYRGSIETVRANIRTLVRASQYLCWLNEADVISLSKDCALIGHDGWADGRYGDFQHSRVELNDFHLIEELNTYYPPYRLARMQALADEAAQHFSRVLPLALKQHRRVIALTHVPPFQEATWHEGRMSGPEWLPFFSSKAVGDVLRSVMSAHPEHHLTVLCGHTHGSGEVSILPNLNVITGGATYGYPELQRPLLLS